jgi:hypothetical protein
MVFQPEETQPKKLPMFETLNGKIAPGYSTEKTESELLAEISQELALMDGYVTSSQRGSDNVNGQKRHGYNIEFMLYGKPAKMTLLSYPFSSESKRTQALRHVLYVAREHLKWMRMMYVMTQTNPLLPYMIADGEGRTAMEVMQQRAMALPEKVGNA